MKLATIPIPEATKHRPVPVKLATPTAGADLSECLSILNLLV